MSLIDILMPVRNAAPFLAESVGSIASQSLTDWRLIAVDDRSTDDTWAMLCTLGKRDDRILALKGEGSGVVRALNTALAHSRAPFLARMDSDDISASGRLEKLLAIMNSEPDAAVVGSRIVMFPPEVVTPNMRRYIKWQNSLLTPGQIRKERYVESTLTHATAMFRRDVLMEAEGWREGFFPEDLDLWLRLHRKGKKFIKHPDVLYLWREHGQRETRSSERCTPEAFHRCKAVHLAEELVKKGCLNLAVLGPAQARRRWTKSLSEKGFKVQPLPWKPGQSIPGPMGKADFILAVFAVPGVRAKAREELKILGKEDERWLFVG